MPLSGCELLGRPVYPIAVSFDLSPGFVFVYLPSLSGQRTVVDAPYNTIVLNCLLATKFEGVLPCLHSCTPNSAFA